MKVFLSNYRDHWISPYTMLDYAFFWTDWSKCSRDKTVIRSLADERDHKYVERPEWAEKWSDRLTPISQAIQWVWDRVHPKINYVKIDRWDTWSMDHTLAHIILPMLKQLKEKQQGAGFVDDQDVPEGIGLRSTEALPKENEWDTDSNHFARWEWVMNEMIFAFECKIDDSWEDAFRQGEIDMLWVPVDVHGNEVPKGEHKYYQMKDGPKNTYKCDYDGMKVVQNRIDNGFRLFGRYYQNLWD
jgi:hypothetical protein